MQRKALLWIVLLLPGISVSAQDTTAVEFLKAEIQRTARQRDEANKRLLKTESLSADKIKILSEEQNGLQKRLNQTSKSLLELEAAAQMSKVAIERSEQALQAKEADLQALKTQQRNAQVEFERVTEALNAKLAAAQALALPDAGAEAAELAAQREQLRQDLQAWDTRLSELEAARQQDLIDLNALQQMNQQLTEDLNSSKRAESLANAKLAALESRLGGLQQELANQYQQRSELEQEKEKLEGVITDLQTQLTEAESNFEAVRKQRDLLQAKEKTLTSKVDQLEKRLEESDGQNRALARQNEFLEKQLKDERRIRERMENDIADLRATMQKAKDAGIQEEDLEEVALLVAEMEREKEAFREEAMTHRKNVDVLRAELDNQSNAQQVQIRELQQMLVLQLEEMAASQKKIQNLEARSATLDDVRKQKAQLVTLQTKSREDMRTLAGHIYELREELVKNKETQRKAVLAIQKNQELANEMDAVRAEMEKLKRLNAALQNVDSAKEDRIYELRQELETKKAQSEAMEREKRELILELQRLQEASSREP
jgi:chromosome segregation ATPase